MNSSGQPEQEEEVEIEADIPELARDYGQRALKIIAAIMEKAGPGAPVRLRAAEALLNMGWGKPETRKYREPRRYAPVGKIIRVIVDPQRDKQALKKALRAEEGVRKTEPVC